MTGRFCCRGPAETAACGRRLARSLAPGSLIAVSGPLGAGKTVFVRGIAEGCGLDPREVVSPSFVLAIDHPDGSPPLLHVDLYRLPAGAGLDDLGIEEALDRGALVAVEWGDRLPETLLSLAVRVAIEPGRTPTERRIAIARPRLTRGGSSAPLG